MHDLSLVTDTLRQILSDALAADPLWGGGPPPFPVAVSGQHPEQPGLQVDCELNLYIFHIAADKFLANSFWASQAQSGGGGQQPVAFEPLCLDLWYMLSAQSKISYVQEQQVLGVAMRAFHEHGTVKIAAPTPPPNSVTPSEASLVLESPTFDELSRLWQALVLPLRTTAQYRVSVVFLTEQDPPAPQPPVISQTVAAAPADLPADPALPHLLSATSLPRCRGCRPPSRTSSHRRRPRLHRRRPPVRRWSWTRGDWPTPTRSCWFPSPPTAQRPKPL